MKRQVFYQIQAVNWKNNKVTDMNIFEVRYESMEEAYANMGKVLQAYISGLEDTGELTVESNRESDYVYSMRLFSDENIIFSLNTLRGFEVEINDKQNP